MALIDLLINFRVHPFDNDHLISNECHAPLILLAQQVPILPPPPTKIRSSEIVASLEDSKVLPFARRENAPQESERRKAQGGYRYSHHGGGGGGGGTQRIVIG